MSNDLLTCLQGLRAGICHCTAGFDSPPKEIAKEIQATVRDFGQGITPGKEMEILCKCYSGVCELGELTYRTTYCFLDGKHSLACASEEACNSAVSKIFRRVYESGDVFNDPEALILLETEDFFDDAKLEGLCKRCVAFFKARHKEGRKKAWAALPACFGLELSDTEGPALASARGRNCEQF
ncbi:hypothetical protein EW146_g4051 [Bondarzewia mesenterica]|uniref:Uncharacterized protein n=1 Tax=Bondarzewia mesenterica TaxID=1095465 RepID=A0A4S4LVN8_9AGAM|nr:hypothetical protein EW146_g4051 [Bondarzewia mesenterica]